MRASPSVGIEVVGGRRDDHLAVATLTYKSGRRGEVKMGLSAGADGTLFRS